MVRPVTNDDTGLKILRDAPADAVEPVDIVAVHGIGAHPDDSWCKNIGTADNPRWVNWLVDESMLPAVAPEARIMRYGYQSQWFGEGAMRQNSSTVAQRLLLALRRGRKENPFRPLLFVAHCFGGLMVLKSLLEACHHKHEWDGLFASTTGLIFFGTPFRGAEGMSQVEMLAAAQSEYGQDDIQPEVLRILQPGNEFLQELVDQFCKTRALANKAPVACFYELGSSNVGRIVGKVDRMRLVVSESSGCLDQNDSTRKFSLSRTHFDMNKFGKPTEEDFETVSDEIKRMVKSSPALMLARSQYKSHTEDPKARECREALYLTDPYVVRESLITAKGDRVAGTCEWITRNSTYLEWLNDSGSTGSDNSKNNKQSRLLWIAGGPGKGKTMMSIYLTEELSRHTADSQTSDLVFFFCGAGDENRNTAVSVLRGLVHQILVKRPRLIGHALTYFESPERARQTLSSLEALWLILSKLIVDDRLGTIFCLLDGLDECEEQTTQPLLRRILDLLTILSSSKTKSMFKLVIVSRDIPILRDCTTIRLDPDNNQRVDSDISTFVRTKIKDLRWIEGFEHIKGSVQDALIEQAEGTFLWVGFAMHELLQVRTCTEIQKTLDSLPSGLPALYGRMLLRIPPGQRDSARTLLQWVAFAARPLRLPELAAAISMPESLPRVEAEQAARDLVILCGPLLRSEQPSREPYGNLKIVQGQEVSLVHHSVQDYLLRGDYDSHPVLETFRFDKAIIHLQLTQQCLDCINQRGSQRKPYLSTNKPPHQLENPLLGYAALHWPDHAKQSSALATKLYKSHEFFRSKNEALRRAWWETGVPVHNNMHWLNPLPPLLHIACILGLLPLVEVVLGQQDWRPRFHRRINEKYMGDDTPLHSATRRGNVALVRLLLQNGASLEIKNKKGYTPLQTACRTGTEEVVRFLLQKGANLETKDKKGYTPLHTAYRSGTEEVVRLLLQEGADSSGKNRTRQTLLHMACEVGDEATVRLALDMGAGLKGQDEQKGRTALHYAAGGGYAAVVRLVLNHGADIEAQDNDTLTALHYAAAAKPSGHAATVQLLLQMGADIAAETRIGHTALHMATQHEDEAMAELLIEKGADVTACDKDQDTPLHYAAYDGSLAISKLFIDKGASVEAKTKRGMTPLHLAAASYKQTSVEVLQLLLDCGADIDAKDQGGNTALSKAAAFSAEMNCRILLDRGADTKMKNFSGHGILYEAAKPHYAENLSQQVWTMVLLIEAGADVEELNNEAEAAAYRNCKRLLRERSDAWEAHDNGGNPTRICIGN